MNHKLIMKTFLKRKNSLHKARRNPPAAFRTSKRSVTPSDDEVMENLCKFRKRLVDSKAMKTLFARAGFLSEFIRTQLVIMLYNSITCIKCFLLTNKLTIQNKRKLSLFLSHLAVIRNPAFLDSYYARYLKDARQLAPTSILSYMNASIILISLFLITLIFDSSNFVSYVTGYKVRAADGEAAKARKPHAC